MAQAETRNITRRVALTAVALSPAVALPALATVDLSGARCDAELLALAPALEAVIAERAARLALDAERDDAYERACEAAGLPRIPYPKRTEMSELEWSKAHAEYLAYHAKREAVRSSIMDPAEAAENQAERAGGPSAWDWINDRMFPVIDKILACQPTTIAGLGIVARAASLLSESTVGSDLSHSEYESLVQTILDFTDTEPVGD